jgi:hypothetical protein
LDDLTCPIFLYVDFLANPSPFRVRARARQRGVRHEANGSTGFDRSLKFSCTDIGMNGADRLSPKFRVSSLPIGGLRFADAKLSKGLWLIWLPTKRR